MNRTAADIILQLALEPLPHEGGWFRRTAEGPAGPDGRPRYAVIYALFTAAQGSALHRLDVDEIWCHLAGDALEQLRVYSDGTTSRVWLGQRLGEGMTLQTVVPAGVWQAARVGAGGNWTLVACTTIPGFAWEGFQLAAAAGRRDVPAEAIAELDRWTRTAAT